MATEFTRALKRLWPKASASLIDAMVASAPQVFQRYGINTPLRLAHFMAQISHESNGGTVAAENLSYTTPQRIASVWPRRFTVDSAQAYVRNPRKLASKVYNGRMGNRPGTEDGYTYRGRGLLQLTGRSAYEEMGQLVGLDLTRNPDLVFSPRYALEIAAAEFKKLGCIPFCDRDDLRKVTLRVNGGTTGLDDRRDWLTRWKQALPDLPGDPEEIEENEQTPRGDEPAPPKDMTQSKTGWAAIFAAVMAFLQATKDQLADFGLWDFAVTFIRDHSALMLFAAVAAVAFIWWDRRRKLKEGV
jgi:putative chitinase